MRIQSLYITPDEHGPTVIKEPIGSVSLYLGKVASSPCLVFGNVGAMEAWFSSLRHAIAQTEQEEWARESKPSPECEEGPCVGGPPDRSAA